MNIAEICKQLKTYEVIACEVINLHKILNIKMEKIGTFEECAELYRTLLYLRGVLGEHQERIEVSIQQLFKNVNDKLDSH